jgi:hypothetical protein
MGRTVGRPIKPTSIELSQNEAELRDPRAYPVKVPSQCSGALMYTLVLNPESGASETTECHR